MSAPGSIETATGVSNAKTTSLHMFEKCDLVCAFVLVYTDVRLLDLSNLCYNAFFFLHFNYFVDTPFTIKSACSRHLEYALQTSQHAKLTFTPRYSLKHP